MKALTILSATLLVALGVTANPASAHTIGYAEATRALMGSPGDDDIKIKWNRLESAFDVNIVAAYPIEKVRPSDHVIDELWVFERANGKTFTRLFVSRFTETAPNRWISDAPDLPY